MRNRKEKWEVYGEYGGRFTNLKAACDCAKEASKTAEHNFESEVWLMEDGLCYVDYANGKCVRDGWTVKR